MNRSAPPNLDTGNESRRWLALLAILLAPSLALVERARAEEWSFVGARYQGMGGAGVAVVDDEQASYWNPGALAFTKSYGVVAQTAASRRANSALRLATTSRPLNPCARCVHHSLMNGRMRSRRSAGSWATSLCERASKKRHTPSSISPLRNDGISSTFAPSCSSARAAACA